MAANCSRLRVTYDGADSTVPIKKGYLMKKLHIVHPLAPLALLLMAGIPGALAESPRYSFQKIATLSTPCMPAAGGVFFQADFEPWGINKFGDLAFAADFTADPNATCAALNFSASQGERAFLSRNGQFSQMALSGQTAPGGGTFVFVDAHTAINDSGDVAFAFALAPLFPAD